MVALWEDRGSGSAHRRSRSHSPTEDTAPTNQMLTPMDETDGSPTVLEPSESRLREDRVPRELTSGGGVGGEQHVSQTRVT